jgi:site-specific DNA recombinase
MMYGDELYDGEHPRLIDDVTYRQAQRLLGAAGRELRVTGTNPEYVLRGLLRCGGCGEAMCPGSTTKKSGKTYRFYRCSTRDKYGTDRAREAAARGRPRGLRRRAHHGGDRRRHARRRASRPSSRRASRRSARRSSRCVERWRRRSPRPRPPPSKLTDEVVRLEGRARELVEAKLRAEAARLDDAERRLARSRTTPSTSSWSRASEWFVGALRNFGKVWGEMTPENQGRLLRALVAKVSVDEKTGMCRVELVNFDAVTSAKEAA